MAGGRDADAMSAAKEALEVDGNFSLALYFLGAAYARAWQHVEAVVIFEKLVAASERSSLGLANLAWAYGGANMRNEAETILAELKEKAEREYIPNHFFAWVLSTIGRMDEAFAYLEKAVEERHPHLVFHMIFSYDHLRPDPRFQELLRRIEMRTP